MPFQVPIEPGCHVESTRQSDWDAIGDLLRDLGLPYAGRNETVETEDWRSWVVDERVAVEKSTMLADLGVPADVASADSLSLQYGKLPRHALPHQHATDLVVEAYWADWRGPVDVRARSDAKVEVGLLAAEAGSLDAEHLVASGAIRELGEHKKWQRTIVNYGRTTMAAAGSQFTASFETPVGLHPKHVLNITGARAPHDVCHLYAKYTIPKQLFLDRYQLADLAVAKPNKPATGELLGVWGETDLEAPAWTVPGWGSEAIVRIRPDVPRDGPTLAFTLPMHSRYEVPGNGTDTAAAARMPVPDVFWACQDLVGLDTSEMEPVGYKSVFPPDTVFYHIQPAQARLHTELRIPVVPASSFGAVQAGTAAAILAGFVYVLTKVWRGSRPGPKPKTE